MRSAEDFRALERSRLQALVERDMPLARRLHAPDFQLVTPRGVQSSKTRSVLGHRHARSSPGQQQATHRHLHSHQALPQTGFPESRPYGLQSGWQTESRGR